MEHGSGAVNQSVTGGTLCAHTVHILRFIIVINFDRNQASVVCIATVYELGGLGVEFRWGTGFSAPVQNSSGTQPDPCIVGTGPFPGVM